MSSCVFGEYSQVFFVCAAVHSSCSTAQLYSHTDRDSKPLLYVRVGWMMDSAVSVGGQLIVCLLHLFMTSNDGLRLFIRD